MKYNNRLIIGFFAFFIVASGVVLPVAAQSPELSPEKIEQIRNNCEAAQSAIQRTQRSDIVSRTNKGRSYEYILRLMASLNSRIALSKMSQPRMVEVTSTLQAQFEGFYQHYTSYENSVNETLGINCREKPTEFYESLQTLRENRARIARDVQEMQVLIEEYNQLVAELEESLNER